MRWLDITNSMNMTLSKNPGDDKGQGSLVCCRLRSHKEIQWRDWTAKNRSWNFRAEMGLIGHLFRFSQYLVEKEMATNSSLLAGEFHGQRSLAVCSPSGCKESDATERLPHMMFRKSNWSSETTHDLSKVSSQWQLEPFPWLSAQWSSGLYDACISERKV